MHISLTVRLCQKIGSKRSKRIKHASMHPRFLNYYNHQKASIPTSFYVLSILFFSNKLYMTRYFPNISLREVQNLVNQKIAPLNASKLLPSETFIHFSRKLFRSSIDIPTIYQRTPTNVRSQIEILLQ